MITKKMAGDFLRKLDEEAAEKVVEDEKALKRQKKLKEQQNLDRAPLTHNPFAAVFEKKGK